jgi:hypothetical protein
VCVYSRKKEGEDCDVLGVDTKLGFCEDGLECVEDSYESPFEPGKCQETIQTKKPGEPCEIYYDNQGLNPTSDCKEGLICTLSILNMRIRKLCSVIE